MLGPLALVLSWAPPEPVPQRLPPVEQCSAEAGFDEFRTRLKNVVARRDEDALLAMLSDDVEVNFGGDVGPALFSANWKFPEPGQSHVWAELDEALSQGCARSGDALVAPSFVSQFPEQLDAFETLILPPAAQLRSAKTESSAASGPLDWHLARIVDGADDSWVEVKLVDGRPGFVRWKEAVRPLDYRLVFEKRDGGWRITAFVAGD